VAGLAAGLLLLLVVTACAGTSGPEPAVTEPASPEPHLTADPPGENAASTPPAVDDSTEPARDDSAPAASVAADSSQGAPLEPQSYLLFNERLLEGLASDAIDLASPDVVFRHVFSRLPPEVDVLPSENYYYFILRNGGRQIWGNIRLAAGQRELGSLSFGYFEFIEFPTTATQKLSGSKFFGPEDGVVVVQVDRFTYDVTVLEKKVRFHLRQLDQTLPAGLTLAPGERFIQRTFDESGYQFYLLFNEDANHFLWVLNEEDPVPDILKPYGDSLLIGRRSGFAFWLDPANGGRKVLAGVRQLNIRRNDYFDGPFDQLADNYADETQVAEYMQRAFPSLRGRIDKFGYYTDTDRPLRVALSTYYTYASTAEIIEFVDGLQDAADPYALISRGGREVSTS